MSGVKRPADKAWSEDYLKAARGEPDEEEDEGPVKVDVLGRRIYDKEKYAKMAAERGDEYVDDSKTQHDIIPAEERGFLQRRSEDLNIDAEAGKRKMVTATTMKKMQGGFWCTVCECMLKDSIAWLDHINGRRHNRLLG